MKISEAIAKLGDCVTKQTLLTLCRSGEIPAKMSGREWDISDVYIDRALAWRREAVRLEDLLDENPDFKGLSEKEKRNVRRTALHRVEGHIRHHIEFPLFTGVFLDMGRPAAKWTVDTCIREYVCRNALVPVAEAAQRMGVSLFQCKQMLSKGLIKGCRIGNDWYLDPDDIDAWGQSRDDMVGIYDLLKENEQSFGETLFRLDDRVHRQMLNNFIKSDPLLSPYLVPWDQSGLHGDRRNAYYIPQLAKQLALDVVTPYIRRFGVLSKRLLLLEGNKYWQDHPENATAVARFCESKQDRDKAALMQMIIDTSAPEIGDWTNEFVQSLADYADAAPAITTYARALGQFLNYIKVRYEVAFSVAVKYDDKAGNRKKAVNTNPYSVAEYLAMSYMAFKEEFMRTHCLISKAQSDPKMAYLWLYTCWHYVAAWRISDIKRIPVIDLPWSKEEIEKDIACGTYKEKADTASLLLEGEICDLHMLPSKTEDRQKIAFLTVHISETLRPVLGLVYLLNWIHAEGEDVIKSFRLEAADYTAFFGEDYERLFGKTCFQNRRANKAYMNEIAEIVEKGESTDNKVMSYVVGSHIRAHTSSLNSLSEVTSRYLQHNLEGFTVDEIVTTLLDDGPCSFVTYLLFAAVYGEKYEHLGFKQQSELISESGFTALGAEQMAILAQRAYIEAEEGFNQVFQGMTAEDRKVLAEKVLRNIAGREAMTHIHGIQCLLHARGIPCPNGHKCMGCRFAIYFRGFFLYAVQVIENGYGKLAKARTEGERRKIETLLEKVYLPSILQAFQISKAVYGMDVRPFAQRIMQCIEGRKNAQIDSEKRELDYAGTD